MTALAALAIPLATRRVTTGAESAAMSKLASSTPIGGDVHVLNRLVWPRPFGRRPYPSRTVTPAVLTGDHPPWMVLQDRAVPSTSGVGPRRPNGGVICPSFLRPSGRRPSIGNRLAALRERIAHEGELARNMNLSGECGLWWLDADPPSAGATAGCGRRRRNRAGVCAFAGSASAQYAYRSDVGR